MKSLIKVTILMILIIILMVIGVYSLKLFGINSGPATQVVPFLAMVSVSIVFLKVIDKKELTDIGLKRYISMDFSLILLILALLPIILGIIMEQGIHLTKKIDLTLIVTILYCFIIGFSEEFTYRGYIYNTISINKLKIIVSALAFASFHFISPEFNMVLFILYFIFGVTKAYIYKLIKNLWPLIIFHMIWDLGTTYTDYYSNAILDLVCLIIAIIVIKLTMKIKGKKKLEEYI